ncbi:hypothetical protein [Bacillus sp. AFS017336]|uniref:hypothetical protein n=1 Tax=Bacillus sp. AFS017336 TaxID=2033489 RepID=UPI000BF0214D|nr:hypothetical protein [Bacillus sp. AFS017336]PEL13024.1 hypothetical protein CN601_05925 [Bacillus sp. AFS017336]
MERNRDDMGISRKFAKGSTHQNATGKFTIMDRFRKENITYLEFQWLSGEKTGEVEVNKEGNMNASIHKFNASRGITPAVQYTEKVEPFVEKIDEILDKVEQTRDWLQQTAVKFDEFTKIIDRQNSVIENLVKQVTYISEKNQALINQQRLMEKILDAFSK